MPISCVCGVKIRVQCCVLTFSVGIQANFLSVRNAYIKIIDFSRQCASNYAAHEQYANAICKINLFLAVQSLHKALLSSFTHGLY